jgi:hypothetical protein
LHADSAILFEFFANHPIELTAFRLLDKTLGANSAMLISEVFAKHSIELSQGLHLLVVGKVDYLVDMHNDNRHPCTALWLSDGG